MRGAVGGLGLFASGPLAVVLAVAAWWRTRTLGGRLVAMIAIVLAITLMILLAYGIWWAVTQSR
jgi:hypothetical protein